MPLIVDNVSLTAIFMLILASGIIVGRHPASGAWDSTRFKFASSWGPFNLPAGRDIRPFLLHFSRGYYMLQTCIIHLTIATCIGMPEQHHIRVHITLAQYK